MGLPRAMPKSPALKMLLGNTAKESKADLLEGSLKLPAFLGKAPKHFARDERALWTEIGERLFQAKLISDVDTLTFELLVVEMARWRRCESAMRKSRDKTRVMTPLEREQTGELFGSTNFTAMLKNARAASASVQTLAAKFGMSPACRSRVSVGRPATIESTTRKTKAAADEAPADDAPSSFAEFEQ